MNNIQQKQIKTIVEALDSPHTTFEFIDELQYSPELNQDGFLLLDSVGESNNQTPLFPILTTFKPTSGDLY